MILKSFEINNKIKTLDKYQMVLLYGENEGLKKDLKNKIKNNYDKSETLNYFQDELISNDKTLINELANQSLFSKTKLVFINQANDKILNIINEILDQIKNEKIFIFAGTLEKKSKLRGLFEKTNNLGIVPCYNDTEQTLVYYVRDRLKDYKGINSEIVNYICQNSNFNRLKIINEIEKIQSFFIGKSIDLADIRNLLNESKNEDFDQLKDQAFLGNLAKTNKLLGETYFDQQEMNYFINKINFRLQRLLEISIQRKNEQNISQIINNIKPPVFWKEKPILTEQAKRWDKTKIYKFLDKTYKAEKLIRNENIIKKDVVVKDLLQDICFTATISS